MLEEERGDGLLASANSATHHLILRIAVDEVEEDVLLDGLASLRLLRLLYVLEEGAYAAITATEAARDDGLTLIHQPVHGFIDKESSSALRVLRGVRCAVIPKQLLTAAIIRCLVVTATRSDSN